MGICQTSSIKLDKNNKSDTKAEQSIQNSNQLDKSKTIRIFDQNQNKIVEVPVLVPATKNSLYSKRQSHSPICNHDHKQLVAQSS